MATGKESYRERQIEELEAIKSIFGNDVEDLRTQQDKAASSKWRPTDIRINLTPLRDSSNGHAEVHVRTKLHVVCPSRYPKVVPKIFLEETKGISDQVIDELLEQLQNQAQTIRGEVMIYELSQTVQTFLTKHNKPPRGSFYDEMLEEKLKREVLQKQKETLERQTLIDEVERRKEIFKNEGRRRAETRRSESNHPASSSESSESQPSPLYRGHIYPNRCAEHRNRHSNKGCIAYTGIDNDTGQLLYVTEWNIKYSHLETSCNNGGKCLWNPSETRCLGNHRVDDVISSIERQVTVLSQIYHKNLVHYECVQCIKRKEGLIVYLVQDFVLGTSVYSLSTSLGWYIDGARIVASGVLHALIFLHNKGYSHNHLLDTTVFMDNTGTIRCTDFSIVPSLLQLIGGLQEKSVYGDLPALGALIECLTPTQTVEMRDFIEKCNSQRTLSASELLGHPFLRSTNTVHKYELGGNMAQPDNNQRRTSLALAQLQVKKCNDNNLERISSLPTGPSRLHTEFEILTYLGKGAFGDVLKVRNMLDNRQYAIKRIQLRRRSRQFYKKMTREVELLSRLNHENVVRYFNSWIERPTPDDIRDLDILNFGDCSASEESLRNAKSSSCLAPAQQNETESSSSLWPNIDDSDSDGIEFVNSDGEVAVYEDDEEDKSESAVVSQSKASPPKSQYLIMYIQMEFCENCTLRTAIDHNLFQDTDRVWRLFREIAEGLSHIHQQGIIHRDLKPVNIFLDSRDQIKIGDFGLATTSFLALQSYPEQSNHPPLISTEDGTATGTGKVGTTLYVAPELTENASKSTYSQKVDMYTLGIILFEMCQPPFKTSMERSKTIIALRDQNVIIPKDLLQSTKYEKPIRILRWLLNHDPAQRPTAEELLQSELVPPAQLEANELQEMLRHVLANPQSKSYKHLVARCLQQESDKVLEHTYHLGSSRTLKSLATTPITLDSLISLNPVVEYVKSKIVNLFRTHGGIEIDTPLLSPYSKHSNPSWVDPVRLMTQSGCVVVLPNDLRTQFARQICRSGVNMVRRYCVDRVYREEKVFNFHPKQSYECAFDIISPNSGSHLVDAELLSLAYDIVSEIPRLREKNLTIRINHTNLLRAILLYCNVPESSYGELFGNMLDYIESRVTKFQLQSCINVIMEKSRAFASTLMDLLLANFMMSGSRSCADDSSLKGLLRSKCSSASLAKSALSDLEDIVSLARDLGVRCPFHVYAGLPINYERTKSGGVIWQMIADLKPNRTARPSVLAVGERYDSMLHDFQKQVQSFNPNMPNRPIGGAGLSVSLDQLVAAIGSEYVKDFGAIDVGVCVSSTCPPYKDITQIMLNLWKSGTRCGILEASTAKNGDIDEAQDLAKLGASHVILVASDGVLRVRTWECDRFHDRHVTLSELIDYLPKMLYNVNDTSAATENFSRMSLNSIGSAALNTSGSSGRGDGGSSRDYNTNPDNKQFSISNQLPEMEVDFVTIEKITGNHRKRYLNQVRQQMLPTLAQFDKKECLTILVIDLPSAALNALIGAIYPRNIGNKETDFEIDPVYERFPKYKRHIRHICEKIEEYLKDSKKPIVALYSILDSCYRVLI